MAAVLQENPITSAALLVGSALALRFATRRKENYPPGPPGVPILGNLLDFPSAGFDQIAYGNWADEYGPIISLRAPGMMVVVINSYDEAIAMMERKSTKYSSRPHLTMAIDLMGWGNAFAFTQYGPRFRGYRRVFHEQMGNGKAIANYYPQEESHAKDFVRHVLEQPDKLMAHCFQHAGAIVLRVAYGYKAKDENDPVIAQANYAMETFNEGCSPSRFLVNQIPALKHIPEWVPGAGFQKIAREWNGLYQEMVDGPFNYVKQQLAAGTAEDSFCATWLKKKPEPLEEDYLKNAAGSMLGGGGETTAVHVAFYFLAMQKWPEVQQKLHAEMDRIIGSDRLPTFEDRDNLPYLAAVIKEILRFHPSVPFGLPHCMSEDDVHNGFFIPKGSIVIANGWKMARDPKYYTNPDSFNPDRFTGPTPEHDPTDMVFGFGRRICPGRLLADASLYITMAMAACVFDVQPTKDASGNAVIPEIKSSGGIVDRIFDFPADIKPRHGESLKALLKE